MKTLTLDATLLSPDGKAISLIITSEESQAQYLVDILENAEEFLQWVKGERLGSVQNGWVN